MEKENVGPTRSRTPILRRISRMQQMRELALNSCGNRIAKRLDEATIPPNGKEMN